MRRKLLPVVVTAALAFAIAHFMQFGLPGVTGAPDAPSSGAAARAPGALIETSALPRPAARPAAAAPDPTAGTALAAQPAALVQAPAPVPCAPAATIEAEPGAMVRIRLDGGCRAGAPVLVRHGPLSFSERTGADGALEIRFPAIDAAAGVSVELDGRQIAAARPELPDLRAFERVALQLDGLGALSIRARVPGRGGDTGLSGGEISRFGDFAEAAGPRVEILSLPADAAPGGVVRLSVAAEVTESTCGGAVPARVIQTRADGDLRLLDLAVALPGCQAVGDTLILKNVLQDLKLARN